MKAYYYNLSILRSYAVLTLVAWHSYCSYISWEIIDSPANKLYAVAFSIIAPVANMPLFTFLSGYLFFLLLNGHGKYQDFRTFFFNKTNRLLIPFIILGSIINLCEYGKHYVDIFYGAPNHLWYCLMLFFCFIISWIVEKYCNKLNYLLFAISICYALMGGGKYLSVDSILGWKNVLYFYNFFLAGLYAYKYNILSMIEAYFKKNSKQFCVFVLIYMLLGLGSNKISNLAPITSYTYIVLLFCMVGLLERNVFSRKSINTLINNVSTYSFGIYVFHQWIIWNLTRIPQSINVLKPYMTEHYVLFPFLLTLVVFYTSYKMTCISVKTKLGKYLLL